MVECVISSRQCPQLQVTTTWNLKWDAQGASSILLKSTRCLLFGKLAQVIIAVSAAKCKTRERALNIVCYFVRAQAKGESPFSERSRRNRKQSNSSTFGG